MLVLYREPTLETRPWNEPEHLVEAQFTDQLIHGSLTVLAIYLRQDQLAELPL